MNCQLKPKYIPLLLQENNIKTNNNKNIICYNLKFTEDDAILNDWALHIRRHYISDELLLESCNSLNMTCEDYLKQYCIPQQYEVLGSQCISGDFAEIIISDIFEFLYEYKVPRVKMENRSGKNNSEHGSDVIGLKYDTTPKPTDELVISEVKSNLSNSQDFSVLDTAIGDSQKNDVDNHRYAHTLDFLRKRSLNNQDYDMAKIIARFEAKTEIPYKTIFIPAGINSVPNVTDSIILENESLLTNNKKLIYVHGMDLLKLMKELYRRVCIL